MRSANFGACEVHGVRYLPYFVGDIIQLNEFLKPLEELFIPADENEQFVIKCCLLHQALRKEFEEFQELGVCLLVADILLHSIKESEFIGSSDC